LKWWLVWGMDLRTQAPLSFWLWPVWNDKMGNGKSMEDRRKIWRKFVECSSSFWYSYPFGLCVLILNWSNNRKYVLGKDWLCSSKKNGSGFGQ
jgi:hypothetical protein